MSLKTFSKKYFILTCPKHDFRAFLEFFAVLGTLEDHEELSARCFEKR